MTHPYSSGFHPGNGKPFGTAHETVQSMGYIRMPRAIVEAPNIRVEKIALEIHIHWKGIVLEAWPALMIKEKHIRLAFFGLRRQGVAYSPTSSATLMDEVVAVTRYMRSATQCTSNRIGMYCTVIAHDVAQLKRSSRTLASHTLKEPRIDHVRIVQKTHAR